MSDEIPHDVKVIAHHHAVTAYFYNTSGLKFFEDIFGAPSDYAPDYVKEWVDRYAESRPRAIGKLDFNNFVKWTVVVTREQYHSSLEWTMASMAYRREGDDDATTD